MFQKQNPNVQKEHLSEQVTTTECLQFGCVYAQYYRSDDDYKDKFCDGKSYVKLKFSVKHQIPSTINLTSLMEWSRKKFNHNLIKKTQ